MITYRTMLGTGPPCTYSVYLNRRPTGPASLFSHLFVFVNPTHQANLTFLKQQGGRKILI